MRPPLPDCFVAPAANAPGRANCRPGHERRLDLQGVDEALQVARVRQTKWSFPDNPGRLIGLPWRHVIGHTRGDIGVEADLPMSIGVPEIVSAPGIAERIDVDQIQKSEWRRAGSEVVSLFQ